MLRRLPHLIGFLSAFVLPVLFLVSLELRSFWVALVPFYSLILIPLLDHLTSPNHRNVKPIEALPLALYQFTVAGWVFIQSGALLYALLSLNTAPPESIAEGFFLMWSMGILSGGIGITVAHELIHKKENWAKFCGSFLLSTVAYTHFIIQHIEAHHLLVGSDKDAVSANKGQNIYAFLWRAIPHSWLQSWQIEKRRLHKRNKGIWTLENRMIKYLLGILVTFALFLALPVVAQGFIHPFLYIFLAGQALIAFSLLEMVEYIEHYGLRRKTINGKLEPVSYRHSWNSAHRYSNFLLFQLQRHPDHHGDWMKWYPYLESKNESPQLPSGYPAMIVLAAIPPLWFRVIDPILEEYKNKAKCSVS